MPTRIRKALITAAGPQQRRLPLQSLTDRDGATKPALAIILDEMFAAGIESVGLVLAPGDRPAYESVLAPFADRLVFLEQSSPNGYGHAVLCGREFVGTESFLLQVSDHLYVSRVEKSCTQQLLDLSATEGCAISAVQATHESQLRFYGTVSGTLMPGHAGIYQVDRVIEKPTPTVAEQQCVVPGLRSGHYLCFFGMHVLTRKVFALLADAAAAVPAEKLGLTPALNQLAAREKYLAVEIAGRRADLEAPFGLLRAQISLGLHGAAREEVLALLTEELALDSSRR
ncbi:MAG: UTP--glucose-1-phosphate uridylyltransferase [Opitutaceae bacterium]|nr:UTP--glucose-1-phosphate uridylyltransferase [Opitutaceae bacterium]